MEKNLNKLNLYSVGDIANANKYLLKDKFGIIGLELWNHANGIDNSRISDYKKCSKEESYGHSQVLFKDYNEDNIKIIISEMIDVLIARLKSNKKMARVIGLGIGYSKNVGGGFYHTIKLDNSTDSKDVILKYSLMIFDKFYDGMPIRKVSISCGNLENKDNIQLNLFENIGDVNDIDLIINSIKNKYGKNALLKATNLLKDSTAIERNKKIGGHYS